jgi:hypothetical protein
LPYGDVTYADPGYRADGRRRYPLDSECCRALAYISQADNAAKYTVADEAHQSRIKAAGDKYGINSPRTSRRPPEHSTASN